MENTKTPNSFVLAPKFLSTLGGAPRVPAQLQPSPDVGFIADETSPQAQWNLGGVFLYDQALTTLFGNIRGIPTIHVECVSGSAPCVWTIEWFSMRNMISPRVVVARLKAIAEKKIPFTLYLDNPHISEEMLSDKIGNSFLHLCSEMPQGYVCVASELLAEHVRQNYPGLLLHAGLNKVIAEGGQGNIDYYRAAADKFHRVALHPADACNAEFLKKLAGTISPDKFEITVNDTCLRTCRFRAEHLEALSKVRQSPWNADCLTTVHSLLNKVGCENVPSAAEPESCASILSRAEFANAYELGFRHFRIQAEMLRSEMAFFWEISRWLFSSKPELWHKKALVVSSLSANVRESLPVLKSGMGAFKTRRYD